VRRPERTQVPCIRAFARFLIDGNRGAKCLTLAGSGVDKGPVRILYGVVGEGMGHAMRSRVVLEHLIRNGHDVVIMVSGRAHDFLAKRFSGVKRIGGLHMITEENRIRRGKTLWSNVLAGVAAVPQNIAAYFSLIDELRPEAVISDFESWVYFYGKAHNLPILSVDNMQVLNRCTHGPEVIGHEQINFDIARAFVKTKLPFCDHYLVTTFFFPEVRKERTTLFPPILRPEILQATPRGGEHVLVYQTAEGHEVLEETLRRTGVECRIYGMRRAITEEQREGNLRYRPFDERAFVDDLASARAVIAGGGFTLMGEAVFLRKPMLSVPLENQFEQTLNAGWLQHLGYGQGAKHLEDPRTVLEFLDALPRFELALSRYEQNGNDLLFNALDEHLDRAAAGIY